MRAELLAQWEDSRTEQVAAWASERESLLLQLDMLKNDAEKAGLQTFKYQLYLDRSEHCPAVIVHHCCCPELPEGVKYTWGFEHRITRLHHWLLLHLVTSTSVLVLAQPRFYGMAASAAGP